MLTYPKVCQINEILGDRAFDSGVKILYATEVSSHTYSLANEDSDNDVKFIYVHPKERYLKVQRPKDTMVFSVSGIDFHGWDLFKAATLAVVHNPTMFELVFSPLIYTSGTFGDRVRRLYERYPNYRALAFAYYSTANNNSNELFDGEKFNLKRVLHASRCLLATLYMLRHHELPPLEFGTLLYKTLPSEESDSILRVKLKTLRQRRVIRAEVEAETAEYSDVRAWLSEHLNQEFMYEKIKNLPTCAMPVDTADKLVTIGLR